MPKELSNWSQSKKMIKQAKEIADKISTIEEVKKAYSHWDNGTHMIIILFDNRDIITDIRQVMDGYMDLYGIDVDLIQMYEFPQGNRPNIFRIVYLMPESIQSKNTFSIIS